MSLAVMRVPLPRPAAAAASSGGWRAYLTGWTTGWRSLLGGGYAGGNWSGGYKSGYTFDRERVLPLCGLLIRDQAKPEVDECWIYGKA